MKRKLVTVVMSGIISVSSLSGCDFPTVEERCADDGGTLKEFPEPDGEIDTWCVDSNGDGLWEVEDYD